MGPLLGGLPGWVQSPGLALAEHLEVDGVTVRTTSGSPGRARRSLDVASIGARWRGRVDVVVVMVFSGAALALAEVGLRAASAAGAVPVAWLHGGGLPDHAERHPRAVRRTLGCAKCLVAPSPWLTRWSDQLDVGAGTVTIPNVVETGTPFVRRSSLRPRLLWMRTYHDLYDPLLAVDAFERVLAARPDATLTLAGQDKGLATEVRAAVAARGLATSVDVQGFLDSPAKETAFAEHDLFLSTNRVDNAPVTVVEAGAAGLPVVAVSTGGVPDLLEHGEGGVLVEGRSPEALARAVLGLLDDPDRAGHLSDAGRRRAERHRWDVVGPAWHDLLRSAADA